jgi:hypothetical protein
MSFSPFFSGEPAEDTPVKLVRARVEKGKFKADDPSTPDVNEAWEEKPAAKKRVSKKGVNQRVYAD